MPAIRSLPWGCRCCSGDVLAAVLAVLSNFFFVVTVALMMAFDTGGVERVMAVVRRDRPHLRRRDGQLRARRPQLHGRVAAGFGFIVAVLDGVALAIMGVPGRVRLGRAGLRHQLHPQHRLRHRRHPAGHHRAARRRPRTDDRRHRHLQRDQLFDPVRHPAPRRGRRGGTDRPVHLHVTGVLDLGSSAHSAHCSRCPSSLFMRAVLVEADPTTHWVLPILFGAPREGPSRPAGAHRGAGHPVPA